MEVLALHKHPEYLPQCCQLINKEWKRSDTARLRSLESSSDSLPTCLILVENKKVIGHCRLSPIPSICEACFVESVVIDRDLRGNGYGKHLMLKAEQYCKNYLNLKAIYLSTNDKKGFYSKLGYSECMPVSIYGCLTPNNLMYKIKEISIVNKTNDTNVPAPPPPPLPPYNLNIDKKKIYMNKFI